MKKFKRQLGAVASSGVLLVLAACGVGSSDGAASSASSSAAGASASSAPAQGPAKKVENGGWQAPGNRTADGLPEQVDGPKAATTTRSTQLLQATTNQLGDTSKKPPQDLVQRLKKGGYVLVFRYTGADVPDNPEASIKGSIDDGQRVSSESVKSMKKMGQWYSSNKIPVDDVLSSQYYFVYQHARAALGTGSQ